MKVKIRAQYLDTRELLLEVPDGANPLDPSSWGDIEREDQLDFNLYDVQSWRPAGLED